MREKLAELMHEIWARWMEHVFRQSVAQGEAMLIPVWAVERWARQMVTPYDELSEKEKDSDREVADKVLALINECFAASGRIEDGTDCEEALPETEL